MARPIICGPRDGIEIALLEQAGAHGCRFTADPNFLGQGFYIDQLAEAGKVAVVTFDPDSFPTVDWAQVSAEQALGQYEDHVKRQLDIYEMHWTTRPLVIQVWNEFRGTGGAEESPQPAPVVNQLARLTRERFGRPQLLAHGSTVDGQPSTLLLLDWSDVDLCDLHLYGKVAPNWTGDQMTGVFDLEPFYAVLPPNIRIMSSEIGLSSWPVVSDAYRRDLESDSTRFYQRDYCQSIMTYTVGLPDARLFIMSWFAGHNHNGFGLWDEAGPKPALEGYQAAAATYAAEEPPPIMDQFDIPNAQLELLWNLLVPGIPFDNSPAPQGLGIVRMWCENPYLYGAPLQGEAPHPDGVIQLFAYKAIIWGADGPRVIG